MVNEPSAAEPVSHLEAFIEDARALQDDDRVRLAEARRALDEVVRAAAWRAASEVLSGRGEDYVAAWLRIGSAHIPDRLEELRGLDAVEEIEHWQEIARLVRLALDEALVALLTADTIPPPDIRELLHPWREMQTAAYERRGG